MNTTSRSASRSASASARSPGPSVVPFVPDLAGDQDVSYFTSKKPMSLNSCGGCAPSDVAPAACASAALADGGARERQVVQPHLAAQRPDRQEGVFLGANRQRAHLRVGLVGRQGESERAVLVVEVEGAARAGGHHQLGHALVEQPARDGSTPIELKELPHAENDAFDDFASVDLGVATAHDASEGTCDMCELLTVSGRPDVGQLVRDFKVSAEGSVVVGSAGPSVLVDAVAAACKQQGVRHLEAGFRVDSA